MAQSSILGGQRAPQRNEASRTGALGPSDTSDSGSDIQGGPGLVDTEAAGLDAGPTSDVIRRGGAGADLGDVDLDSDSDSGGSGERALADRDGAWMEGADIAPDRIEGGDEGVELAADDELLEDLTADELGIEDDEVNTDDEGRVRRAH